MTKKILILIGDDKFCNENFNKIIRFKNIDVIKDKSFNLKKLFKILFLRKSLSIKEFLFIALNELFYKKNKKLKKFKFIKNNDELSKFYYRGNYKYLILFRSPIIINLKKFKKNEKIYNLHHASFKYKGLGTIHRILQDKKFNQYARLHLIEKNIDYGKDLMIKKYKLNLKNSYFKNKLIANEASLKLLIKFIKKNA